MSFEPSQSRLVKVSYSNPTEKSYSDVSFNEEENSWYQGAEKEALDAKLQVMVCSYTLVTGSYWKGPINRCLIQVEFDSITPEQIQSISPAGAIISAWGIAGKFTNLEPTQNVAVTFLPNMKVSEMPTVLQQLHERHPEDVRVICLLASEHENQAVTLYREALHNRKAPLVLWRPKAQEQPKASLRSLRYFEMAQRLAEIYRAKPFSPDTTPVAAQIQPIFEEALRQLNVDTADWGAKASQRKSLEEVLAWCKKYAQ